MPKENKYSDEFIFDKYLFSVEKFDKLLTYISTGSIALLLAYYQRNPIDKYKESFVASLVILIIVVFLNLLSWYITTRTFYCWVNEDGSKKNKWIDRLGKITEVTDFINVFLIPIAAALASFAILNN